MDEVRKKCIENIVHAKLIKRTVWILWVVQVLSIFIYEYVLLVVGCENTYIDDVCYIFCMIVFILGFIRWCIIKALEGAVNNDTRN